MGTFSDYLMSKNKGDPRGKPTPKPRPKLSHDFGIKPEQIIGEIKKIIFQKSDILVLKYQHALSMGAKINIERSCEQVLSKVGLKNDVGIIVLEQGLDILAVLTQVKDDCGHKEAKNPIGVDEYLEQNKIL